MYIYICIHIYTYKYIHTCICIYILLGNCVTSGLDQRALSSGFVVRFVVVSLCLKTKAMSKKNVSFSNDIGDVARSRQCSPLPKAINLCCCTRQCCRTAVLVQPADRGGSISALQQISAMSCQ